MPYLNFLFKMHRSIFMTFVSLTDCGKNAVKQVMEQVDLLQRSNNPLLCAAIHFLYFTS